MLVNRLPLLMQHRGVSIRQLARETGITYTTIRAVYHGQRRSVQLEVLDAICQALRVQPGDIYHHVPDGDRLPEIVKEPPSLSGASANARRSSSRPAKRESQSGWRNW